jgi:hypothetical protein
MLSCRTASLHGQQQQQEQQQQQWRRKQHSCLVPANHAGSKIHCPRQMLCVSAVVCRILFGSQARFFDNEITPKRKHGPRGCVGMASAGSDLNASQVR